METARGVGVTVGFFEYSRVGVPLTVATLLIGWAMFALVPGTARRRAGQ